MEPLNGYIIKEPLKGYIIKTPLNSQAGVRKSNPQAGGSPKVAISWKTLAKGFKIKTTVLADAGNHNLVLKSEEIS